MRLSEAGELSLLEILRNRFGKSYFGVELGIGDDAAVIRPLKGLMLLTTDMMVEGVHFDLSWTTPFQLGFKLVSVNVSDIYAMGGDPNFLLINFSAPGDADFSFFSGLFDGIEAAMNKYSLSLIGGDISSSDKVVLSATLAGNAGKVLSRRGARVGDSIYVTGPLGEAACGLALMRGRHDSVTLEDGNGEDFGLPWETVLPLISRHLMPAARSSRLLVNKANCMMDISDGLAMDISRLCRESGVGALIYEDKVPISAELRTAACHLGLSPMELALSGGEDYELLFTAPAGVKVDAFCIGEIIESGVFLLDGEGHRRPVPIKGYQHFKV